MIRFITRAAVLSVIVPTLCLASVTYTAQQPARIEHCNSASFGQRAATFLPKSITFPDDALHAFSATVTYQSGSVQENANIFTAAGESHMVVGKYPHSLKIDYTLTPLGQSIAIMDIADLSGKNKCSIYGFLNA